MATVLVSESKSANVFARVDMRNSSLWIRTRPQTGAPPLALRIALHKPRRRHLRQRRQRHEFRRPRASIPCSLRSLEAPFLKRRTVLFFLNLHRETGTALQKTLTL